MFPWDIFYPRRYQSGGHLYPTIQPKPKEKAFFARSAFRPKTAKTRKKLLGKEKACHGTDAPFFLSNPATWEYHSLHYITLIVFLSPLLDRILTHSRSHPPGLRRSLYGSRLGLLRFPFKGWLATRASFRLASISVRLPTHHSDPDHIC